MRGEPSGGPMRSVAVALAGAAILVAFGASRLPWRDGLFHLPETPFDHSNERSAVPWYRLLRSADALVPPGASALARCEPRNAERDTRLHRFAVALLPGRRVLPGAIWNVPSPPEVEAKMEAEAEYLVVLGKHPNRVAGRLLLETPDGAIWRRDSP